MKRPYYRYRDFIITVIQFAPGVVPRVTDDLSQATFSGLSATDLELVTDLALEQGYEAFIIEADQVYLAIRFYKPKPKPDCLAPVTFNQYLFSEN